MIQYRDLRETDLDTLAGWVEHLAGNLRPSDIDELAASSGAAPLPAIWGSVAVSEMAWVVLADGEPVCIFGGSPTGPAESGCVWMLGTPRMDEPAVALSICRQFRPHLAQLHQRWAVLWNYIDARNAKSMAWLQWADFRVLEVFPAHGRQGRPFFLFGRIAPDV